MDPTALLLRFNALPSRLRIALSSGAALAIALGILVTLLTHSDRVALFANPLHAEQMTEVQERLAAWNVPFTPLADNVLVDAKRRNDLLLRLSLAGVPHAHVDASSDVLSKLGALTPQAVIDAQTRAGLAGDIELGLRGIDGVEDARVIIAPAKEAYFADDSSHAATASVRLRLAPGARLSQDAVGGIRSFVAASVPGLDPRSVTILDDRGVALGDGAAADDASDLQRQLQSALDTAIGAGSALVRVHVDYDRSTLTSKEVRRLPLAAVPIASQTQSERYADGAKQYSRSDEQSDRGSETREVTASAQPGRVARITAAVFVDAPRGVELEQVRTLAAATLGIDARRGDVLAVQAITFARTPQLRKDGWWLAYGAIVPLLPTLALAVAALIALHALRTPVASFLKAYSERASISHATATVRGIAPATVRGALANEPPHAAAAIISALPAATAAAVLEMYPEHERSAIIKRMQRPASPLIPDAESFIANA